MANNFSGDANCVALYTFEDDWPTNDSLEDHKGGNDLSTEGDNDPFCPTRTAHGETPPPAEGTYCATFEVSYDEFFELADGSLDSGFPGKSSGGATDISVTAWVKLDSMSSARTVTSKWDGGNNERTWRIDVATDGGVIFYLGYNNGGSYVGFDHEGAIESGDWHHIGVIYDDDGGADSKGKLKIRVYDDDAGAILQSSGSDNYEADCGQQMSLDTAPFGLGTGYYGGSSSDEFDGSMDEAVIFDDILTDDEIDEIRAGTYGAGGGEDILKQATYYYQMLRNWN